MHSDKLALAKIEFETFFLSFPFQRIDYYADGSGCCRPTGHTQEKRSVAEREVRCRIADTNSIEIVRVNLEVPSIPPTDYSTSNVVKVTYYLSVRIKNDFTPFPNTVV